MSVIAGTGIGIGLFASLCLILAGLLTGSSVPLPGWPDPKAPRPVEAGVDELGASPDPVRLTPGPVTTATTPAPRRTPTAPATTSRPGAGTTAQSTRTDVPGQGATHRNEPGKPSKSPGKPG